MPEGSGEKFIQQKYRELHKSKEVEHEQKRRKRAGERVTQKPTEKIGGFMKVLERTHLSHRDDPRVMERIKRYYHKEHVIKSENIPESYFDLQRKIMREQGHGDVKITDEMKKQHAEVIIADQESTLDNWTDYFTSPDADFYPMWAKYWSFNNMLKLSTYDKGKKRFGKRRKDTVAPFPDLNREALAYVVDAIIKKANKEQIPAAEDSAEFKKLIQSENFSKLYAYAIEKVTPAEESELKTTAGRWIKYDQNSDHMPLVESLQGHGTGWCTAGEKTAKAQLKSGDFHVYYSNDQQGTPNVPRVAIRMDQNSIAEVRGIAPDQNLDPYIADVADQKLDRFSDGKQYKKKVADMKQITEIDKRHQAGGELTKEDLRFLHEMYGKIEGFGYKEDPRIGKLLEDRDLKEDLAFVTGCSPDQIGTTKEEALSGDIKYHHGDLNLFDLTSAKGLELPESVGGYLDLQSLTSVEGLKLPDSIGGSLNLRDLISAEGLELPDFVGGDLILMSITSAEKLILPKSVGGNIQLNKLTSSEGLKLSDSVGGNLHLSSLTSAEGLKFPDSVGGNLILMSLTSTEKLILPKSVGGDLALISLQKPKGLVFPESVGGSIRLNTLTSAENLKLPKSVRGDIEFGYLKSSEQLELPKSFEGKLITYLHDNEQILELLKRYPDLEIEIP